MLLYPKLFFFFSSRRQPTRYWRDWSSDVCSSDLRRRGRRPRCRTRAAPAPRACARRRRPAARLESARSHTPQGPLPAGGRTRRGARPGSGPAVRPACDRRLPDPRTAALRAASSKTSSSAQAPQRSALDDYQGPEARDPAPDPRPMRRLDDVGGVLIGLRHLLVNRGPPRGAHQDALLLQLPDHVAVPGGLLGLPAAHLATRAVSAGPEGLPHRALRAGEHE